MMFSTMLMMSLLTSFMIFMSSNPLTMGAMILLLALMVTLMTCLTMSPWLSFLIFLIYISGMLVLFSYFVAITPNLPMPSLFINMLIILSIPIITSMIMMMPQMSPMMAQPELYTTHMYLSTASSTLIMLALILLLAMIIVVKLILMKKGPMRPFM